jgi:hypothetical protein
LGLSSVIYHLSSVRAVRSKSGTKALHKTFTGLSTTIPQPFSSRNSAQQLNSVSLKFNHNAITPQFIILVPSAITPSPSGNNLTASGNNLSSSGINLTRPVAI